MLFGKSTKNMTDAQKRERVDAVYQQAKGSFPGVPEITAGEVRGRQAGGEELVLVDVRTPEEQAVSMISGAITVERFEAESAKHKGATVVCYCTIGGRSGQHTQQLRARGVEAFNMPGAVLSWSHEGGEFVSAGGPTKQVHTHNARFDLLAAGYEAIW